jgi:hypothetical protein
LTNKVKFTTPFGVARYPHISSPDSKGKYADDKFKVKLVLPLGDPAAQAFIKQIDEAFKALGSPMGARGYKPYVQDEEANEAIFILKTKFAPAIFDAKGKAAGGVQVGAGSVIRLMGNIVPFDKGVTMQFNQVQIKELNGFGTCGFDAVEDGYEFDEADASFATGDQGEAGASTSDDTGATDGSALDI